MKAAGRKASRPNLSIVMCFPTVNWNHQHGAADHGGYVSRIHDVESLRQHYALTLREWVRRLEQRHEEALQYVSEPVFRIWRLYMAASALQFEEAAPGYIKF